MKTKTKNQASSGKTKRSNGKTSRNEKTNGYVPKKAKNHNDKYSLNQMLKAYDLAKQGVKNNGIAKTFGITEVTFKRWMGKHENFRNALKIARKLRSHSDTFQKYVYGRLSPEMKEVWKDVMKYSQSSSSVKLELLFDKSGGKLVRQSMFIHALVHCNFNLSAACRMVNIDRPTLQAWQQRDANFNRLLEEIDWHKKNFLEGSLMDLVAMGDKTAIIFVNKTQNADRGYGNKLHVEHKGRIEHDHSHGLKDITPLLDKISLRCKKELLNAQRELEQEQLKLEHKQALEGHVPLNGDEEWVSRAAEKEDAIDVDFEVVDKLIEEEDE